MKRFLTTGVLILTLIWAGAGTAGAVLIDFTDSLWSDVSGSMASHEVAGIQVGLNTNGTGNLTFNGHEGPGTIALGGGLSLAGNGDGIGIRNVGDRDELNTVGDVTERLTISLSPAAIITRIYVLDLFQNEMGVFSLDGGSGTGFQAATNVSWGFMAVPVTDPDATGFLEFWVTPPGPGDDGDNDFAVAGIQVAAAPVPEPGTFLLLGSGLVGLVAARRKHLRM